MATAADAELILKLYEMRRDETLRKARRFMIFDFQPKTVEELRAVSRDVGSQHNAAWRQVLSYWEMAASLVLRGALDADLFLDSNGDVGGHEVWRARNGFSRRSWAERTRSPGRRRWQRPV